MCNEVRKLVDMLDEYQERIKTENQWHGLAYAATYFSELRTSLITELKKFSQAMQKKGEVYIAEEAARARYQLSIDYEELIKKAYATDLPHADKETIADALDAAFLSKLEECLNMINVFVWQYDTKKLLEDPNIDMACV